MDLPATSLPPAAGIVLAGGRSTRFGGDKLGEPVGGAPLLHRPIAVLAAQCAEVIVAIGAEADEPALPRGLTVPIRLVRDPVPDGGPLAGLVAGLRAAREPLALVVGGDMPDLRPALLEALLHRAEETGAGAVALAEGEVVRSLPAVVRSAALPIAERRLASADRSLVGFFRSAGLAVIPEVEWRAWDAAGDSLRDVDTPEDLERPGGPASDAP